MKSDERRKYALLVHEVPEEIERRDGEDAPRYWAAWRAYTDALAQAGVLAGGDVLDVPSVATTVRGSGAARDIHDGPFADTHEQLGGFYLIETAGLDEALAWAARCPAAERGSVEVRPLLERS